MPIIPTNPAKACKIVSHQGGGLYVVEVQYDDTPRTDRMAEIDAKLLDPEFLAELNELRTQWETARDERNAWIESMNLRINAVNDAYLFGDPDQISEAEAALREVVEVGLTSRNDMVLARADYDRVLAKQTALQVERTALFRAGNPPLPLVEAWCIDLADGVGGRALYANGSYAPLVCLNYDTTVYLLPPLNPVPVINGGANKPYAIADLGVYNIMDRYNTHDAAGFTFWNTALEPGFATWTPILMKGVVVSPVLGSCSGTTRFPFIKVRFPVGNLDRFGYELPFGEFTLTPIYFSGGSAFEDGDEVVCHVTVAVEKVKQNVSIGLLNGQPYNAKKMVDVFKISGNVIGFTSNPRVSLPRTNNDCEDIENQSVLFVTGDLPSGVNITNVEETPKITVSSGQGDYGNPDYFVQELTNAYRTVTYDNGVPWVQGSCEIPYRRFWGEQRLRVEAMTVNGLNDIAVYHTIGQSYVIFGDIYIPYHWYDFMKVPGGGFSDGNLLVRNFREITLFKLYYVDMETGACHYEEAEQTYTCVWEEGIYTSRTTYRDVFVNCSGISFSNVTFDATGTGTPAHSGTSSGIDPGRYRERGILASFGLA